MLDMMFQNHLGRFETGSKVAAPIFHDLMKKTFTLIENPCHL